MSAAFPRPLQRVTPPDAGRINQSVHPIDCDQRNVMNMFIPARLYRLRSCTLALVISLFALTAPLAHADDGAATANIIQFGFEPATLQVAAGTTVTWTNHDAIIHSVTSGTPDAPDGAFDSGFFDQDGSFSFAFTDTGDYTYFCMRHNFMRGTVTVVPN